MKLSTSHGFFTTAALALMVTASVAGAQDASFTIIPAQNTQSYSVWVRGVSADGSVAVGVEDGTVFRWTEDGGTEYLSGSNWNNTFAAAVSADGSTIVSTVDDGTGVFSAAVHTDAVGWTNLGGLQPAPPSGGDGLSTGYSISGDGSVVVGLAWVGGGWDAEAFIWNAVDGMAGLGRPVGANSRANDISADGSVIVGWYEHEVNRCRRPARWTPDGTVDVFLGSEICGEAHAVSADGSVIVGSATVPGNDYPTAFRYTDAGGWEDLGKLVPHPFHSAIASGIAENGTIVGLSGDSAAGNWTGFVWTESTGMVSMSDVLTDLGVTSHDGWWLAEARDISADGTTIVGTAIDSSFFLRGYVVTIPVSEIHRDGFESGDTSGWSSTVGGL
jgi:probable HAF family extracellular repeat protein